MELADTSLPVLVLQMDHYGALGVVRSLGRLGVSVYGVHPTPSPVASFSKYCTKVFPLNVDGVPADRAVDALLNIADSIGRRPLLITTTDEAALFVARNMWGLQQGFVFPQNPMRLVWSLYNKREMYFMAKRLSIPTAETVFPESRDDVLEFCERTTFPVMLKASDNITVSRRTGKKMVIVKSKDELLCQYDAMENGADRSLMIQEYIPGTDASVWMFNGYFDENSDCLFGLTGRKLHQTPVYTGMTALGVCLPCPDVKAATLALVKEVGYKGILDIGYRYDKRDRTFKLLDANPRLGATFRLFEGDNGMDVVRAAYLHFTNQPVPKSAMSVGRKWIVEDADIVSSLHYFRDGALTFSDWRSEYTGIQEGAWFASDDLVPFLRMCSLFAVRPFRKLFREARRLFKPSSSIQVNNADAVRTPATRSERLL
jgi:predicted ATP-grasp superfamily ATP-dependent carboligase